MHAPPSTPDDDDYWTEKRRQAARAKARELIAYGIFGNANGFHRKLRKSFTILEPDEKAPEDFGAFMEWEKEVHERMHAEMVWMLAIRAAKRRRFNGL